MNHSWKTLIVLYAAICITAGCNSHESEQNKDKAAILHSRPFAPLTDSLDEKKSTDEAGLYFRRAELLSRNSQHELAAEDYKRSWDLHPDELTGYRFSSSLSILGRIDSAIRVLQDCCNKFPSNPNFPIALGDLYQQAGKIKQAVNVYDDLLHKDSTNFEAWYEKGLLMEKTEDTTGAIDALTHAYALQPINTYGLELAHIYAENRDPQSLVICDNILRKDSARELLD